MIEAIIYNVAVTVSGIYLFHRIQFFEEREVVFKKPYITLLMTIIAILLMTYPIEYKTISFTLMFVPLLFLGRFTNFLYTMLSAVILMIIDIYIIHSPLTNALYIVIIAAVVSTIGPFIKLQDVQAIQVLNFISVIIIGCYSYFFNTFILHEWLLLIISSFILSLSSSVMFADIWRVQKMFSRYNKEHIVDYLTGLGNVRAFDRYLNTVSKQASEQKQSLSLLLIDIDDFKEVNDKFGHDAGDAVLKQMTQVLKNYVPVNSKIYRNGGEEFSVIFSDKSLDDTVKCAESIKNGVINSTFHLQNREIIHLTVTIGIGYIPKSEIKTHRKIFKEADEMLHAAKSQGHDTIMFNPIIK
ncbi:GGDEF domain-containing protein GdpS [Macrococcus armenti]|uniref:GGDEF domain-containing protein GdpS n=1 Tax=Macrococcus armenti TaxID=2875764 RepID=UPI001CCB2E18|nr:GGDEF domain-containing protein [Macrococcus armenti]UBH09158.1 GGDEF domain-containing protein [Macrococcus armenti]UBH11453.1 GGDEF domain-containing protein [Macrococcus armenti]